MEDLERIQERLGRIESIQPVLAALGTISLASWRLALRQRKQVQLYSDQLARAASQLPDQVFGHAPIQGPAGGPEPDPSRPIRRTILVLGSERGLCGRFNVAAVGRAELLLSQDLPTGSTVELLALGSRTGHMLGRRGHRPEWTGRLSLTTLPPFELARGLAERWLVRYEEATLDELYLVYNEYSGIGRYEPCVSLLIPPADLISEGGDREGPDPTPIIETDPNSLYRRLVSMLVAARLHEVLIRSAAAEHSTRYQLMDGASQNAERIIDELTLTVQSARQQAITREMQELAAGAGLVGQRLN
jgi:F-type H+-transporting ATPase subunit gamma